MHTPQETNQLEYDTMDLDLDLDLDLEDRFVECPCCYRKDIFMADLMFCENCLSVFCINCDIPESMRFAHPEWPCPLCLIHAD